MIHVRMRACGTVSNLSEENHPQC